MEVWESTHKDMRTTQNLVSRLLKRKEDLKKNASSEQALIAKNNRRRQGRSKEELRRANRCNNCEKVGNWFKGCRAR